MMFFLYVNKNLSFKNAIFIIPSFEGVLKMERFKSIIQDLYIKNGNLKIYESGNVKHLVEDVKFNSKGDIFIVEGLSGNTKLKYSFNTLDLSIIDSSIDVSSLYINFNCEGVVWEIT